MNSEQDTNEKARALQQVQSSGCGLGGAHLDGLLGVCANRGGSDTWLVCGHVQKNLRKLHLHRRRNPARCPVLNSLHPALLWVAKQPGQLCRPPIVGDQICVVHARITHHV